MTGKDAHVITIQERFDFFTGNGRIRKVIKTDLDQAHFLTGAALSKSGIKIDDELNSATFMMKKTVDGILEWYGEIANTEVDCLGAKTAFRLVEHWRIRPKQTEETTARQLSLFETLEAEE